MILAQWDITGRCNLQCQHCRAWKIRHSNDLDHKEGTALLMDLQKIGVRFLTFSGGEPFSRNDIFDLIAFATPRFQEIAITTNATLLDEDRVKRLSQNPKIRLSISLDGMEKTHDRLRGVKGTFKKVESSLRLITMYKVKTSVRYTLTSQTYKDVRRVIKFLSQFYVQRFNARIVIPSGKAAKNLKLTITKSQYVKAIKQVLEESAKTEIKVISGDPVLIPAFPELIKNFTDEEDLTKIESGCFAGSELIYITPNGDVGPCSYIPLVAGNIRQESLTKIIKRSDVFHKLSNYRDHLKGACRSCSFKNLCGGCRARALSLCGTILSEDPGCLLKTIKRKGDEKEYEKN